MEAIQRGVEKSAQHLSVVGDPRVPVGYQTLESSSADMVAEPEGSVRPVPAEGPGLIREH